MVWAHRFWLRLQALFRRDRITQRLDDEIQFHLDRTKWPEAFSMNRAGPKRLDRCQMLRRRIPLMRRKPIPRMHRIQLAHDPVARHFRPVPIYDALLEYVR